MRRIATSRLIDASASLDAADRALLNIWVNRGLDDAALARMTGMSETAITDRRARIVEHLSNVLGLPPEQLRAALDEIAPAPAARPADDRDETARRDEPPVANGNAPAGGTPDVDAAAPAPATRVPSRRRRPRKFALAVFAAVVAAVVLVLALTSGGSGADRARPPRRPATARHPVTSAAPPGLGQRPGASRQPGTSLVALPGGRDHAAGSVVIVPSGPRQRLALSVSDLPPASHGHYEVWLYDSLTYSEDVARLRNGVRKLSLRIPRNAGRYRWIDISFQPAGDVFHSGESLLRSVNPLFAHTTPHGSS